MLRSGGYGGSLGYIVPLCILTGLFILRWEIVMYQKLKLKREKKFAKALGWINVVAGVGLYIGNWFFTRLL
ncbi:hypothetical protein J4772_27310 [Cohnella sp. LGH]|uniref:Uncharacterized protein n=1 Tax=Cohnella phaseoli TaxID=456490 RepID=A0A3D9IPB0_9BACL|nr:MULTISPECIES: CLC_0170 family protein [Cohnella]QTH41229.1 hypothetical protein J4772_27310 [Cohnella sp. LGH]RED63349.1 hypothetical protein DFP98_12625 [Cohnella phaseoli]